MTDTKHTQGKLHVERHEWTKHAPLSNDKYDMVSWRICDDQGVLFTLGNEYQAKHLVLCWNACADLSDEQLAVIGRNGGVSGMIDNVLSLHATIHTLKSERSDMVAAIRGARTLQEKMCRYYSLGFNHLERDQEIAKVRGEIADIFAALQTILDREER